eukprot:5032531-Prymnesium_polylepis.1
MDMDMDTDTDTDMDMDTNMAMVCWWHAILGAWRIGGHGDNGQSTGGGGLAVRKQAHSQLSLIHISEPTRRS